MTDVVYYVSPLLEAVGVPHAFSTRIGGVSPKPFESLNLGNPGSCAVKDDAEHLRENYHRLQKAMDCEGHPLCHVHQVHGNQVKHLRQGEAFENHQPADAIVSNDPTRLASVRVADCVPILLSRADGKVVAVVHAGWRGVIANVLESAIVEMGGGKDLLAAIGPCIGKEAFEVGPEVIEEFRRVFGETAPLGVKEGNKGHVDLRAAVEMQLVNAGISERNIDTTDRCTYRDSEEFYSHRRDNGVTGRLAALICAKSENRNPKCVRGER